MAARAATLGIFTFFAQACVGCGGTASPTETAAVETAWHEASSAERYPRHSEHFPPLFTAQAPATLGWILGWGTRWPRRRQVTLYEPDEVGGFGGGDGPLADEPNAMRPPQMQELMALLRKDLDHSGRGGPAFVNFQADRRVPWTRIDRWLSDLRLGPIHVEDIALSSGEWMARGGLFVRLAPADGLVAPEIRVEMSAGAEGPFVRIRDGVTLYDFPPGAPYEGEEHLAVSNRHWSRLFAALGRRAALGPLPLALAIDARAPWSHVLQLVSLAAAAGILGVSVEGSRVSMRFTACPSELTSAPLMEPIARGSPFGHPAWMFVVVGVFTAAAFGALLTLGARANATRRR